MKAGSDLSVRTRNTAVEKNLCTTLEKKGYELIPNCFY